jgi:hypothetical protein
MHIVEDLFDGVPCKTRVWLSAQAREEIFEYIKKEQHRGRFLGKLERYAKNGFVLFEGDRRPVSHEWDGVYRVGDGKSLFRLIGFYEDGYLRASFISIDAFLKHGLSLRPNEKARIDEVARVKRLKLWKKKETNGKYPRLAQYPE